ncbi:MAG: LuxR C-terminal-related transcriptional regulator, partial [Mycobacterium sp.]|nr:LuxR C-terminal-related transcriptional regulator [Mycobacterium sp.]
EQSVLVALAEHTTRQAMADALFVSINTVKSQLTSVCRKFGTTGQDTLVRARPLGLLAPETSA